MAYLKRISMFLLLVAACVLALGTTSHANASPGSDSLSVLQPVSAPGAVTITAASLAAFFDDQMPKRLAEFQVPGAVVMVVREGQVLFSKGYGYANLELQTQVNPETTGFRLGSISKLFVWAAALQLVEQGQLNLDADINKYLDWRIPDAFGQPITLRHLMTHSAGFEDRAFETRAAGPETVIPLGTWLRTHIPARVRPPGQFTAYSNYGTDLTAYIVERTSHLPYADYVEQKILNPLGMANTTALQPPPAFLLAQTATGYAFPENTYKPMPYEFAHATASAMMNGTAADMARFMIANLQDGEYLGARFLKVETAQQMHACHLTSGAQINGFCYGMQEMSQNGIEIYGHGGDVTAFHSILALFPAQKMGVFLSYNGVGKPYMQEGTLEAFVDQNFPASSTPTLNPALKDAPRVAGAYRKMRGSYTTMEKLLTLLSWAEVTALSDGTIQYDYGLGPRTLVEVEPLLFRQIDGDDTLLFRANAEGNIIAANEGANPSSIEPYPWYENPVLHLTILAIGYLLMLSVVLVALIGLFRRRGHPAPQPLAARLARYALVAAAMLAFAFVLTLDIGESSRLAFTQGQVTPFVVPMLCSTLVAILTPVVVIGALLAWRRGFWGKATRVHYTLAAIALVGITFSFFTWNLVGLRV